MYRKNFFGKSGLRYTLLSRVFWYTCIFHSRLLKNLRFPCTPLPLFFRALTYISHGGLELEYSQPCNSSDDIREKHFDDCFTENCHNP